MDTKERVIRESIKQVEKRIALIKEIVFSNPLSEILEGRIIAQKIISEHKGAYKKIAELIKPLADKEKLLFTLAKHQSKDSNKLIEEQAKLQTELCTLNNELYYQTR